MWDLIVSVPDHCLSFYFAYIYLLFYLEFDEQFGIRAKLKQERSYTQIFYQQRISVIDVMTSLTSNQILDNHGLF